MSYSARKTECLRAAMAPPVNPSANRASSRDEGPQSLVCCSVLEPAIASFVTEPKQPSTWTF